MMEGLCELRNSVILVLNNKKHFICGRAVSLKVSAKR